MIARLAGCETTGMARRAVISDRNFLMKDDTGKAGKVAGVGGIVTTRAIQNGRNVGRVNLGILADRHYTIVAGRTVINDTCCDMIEDATGKGAPRCMANITIVEGDQVASRWLTGRRNTIVTGIAGYTGTRNCRTGVVDKCVGKICSVMTSRAIQAGRNVRGVGRVNLAGCNGTIMAGLAGYTGTQNLRSGVVGIGTQETDSGMTENAVRVCVLMNCRIRLTYGHSTVVAHAATARNTRMIKTAIQRQFQETGGIVAVIAFDHRRQMKFGFTDGQYTVMAFAAICKYFLMIDKRDNGESLGCMTGLAGITGSEVIRRFPRNLTRPRSNI